MLNIDHLTVSYGKTPVLKDLSLTLKPHTLTAVLGRNGCGKSTLVSCINRQTRYTGTISYGENDLALLPPRERAKAIAILPQVLARPHIPVEELVLFGRNPYLDFGRRPSQADKDAVLSAMTDAGVLDLRHQFVDTLSGGERQKAYLAMILAQQTRLIVLDEPTTYMDIEAEHAFLSLLTRLKQERKKTLLVVLHDLAQAVRYADRIVVLDDHRIVFDGTSADCLDSGILEQVFRVKAHRFTENEDSYVIFSAI